MNAKIQAPGHDTDSRKHKISVFVRDQPGVLARIAAVFSRRGYNIESLIVSPAAKKGFSRTTITCSGDLATLDQIIKQLAKLIDVVHATDHTDEAVVETEIALIKLRVPPEHRTHIFQIVELYKAKIMDYNADSLILRVYGASDKLDHFVNLLRPYEILELVRSGCIAMARGDAQT